MASQAFFTIPRSLTVIFMFHCLVSRVSTKFYLQGSKFKLLLWIPLSERNHLRPTTHYFECKEWEKFIVKPLTECRPPTAHLLVLRTAVDSTMFFIIGDNKGTGCDIISTTVPGCQLTPSILGQLSTEFFRQCN